MFIIYKKDRVELAAEAVCSKLFSGSLLSESAEDKELEKELKEKLAKIKTPEDLKKFMEENADQIKDSYKKADKKSKPVYKKAWDWLCGATEKTAGFLLDHIGGILMLAGILYAGHLIGWSRIKEFFTGKNPDADKQTSEIMDGEQKRFQQNLDGYLKAKKLPPELRKRVFQIRKSLPKDKRLDQSVSAGDLVQAMVAPDSATLAAAKRMRKGNKSDYTSTYFMAELNDVIGSSEDKIDVEKVTKFLDDVESMMASKKKQEVQQMKAQAWANLATSLP